MEYLISSRTQRTSWRIRAIKIKEEESRVAYGQVWKKHAKKTYATLKQYMSINSCLLRPCCSPAKI